jgi:hypothetical protein
METLQSAEAWAGSPAAMVEQPIPNSWKSSCFLLLKRYD